MEKTKLRINKFEIEVYEEKDTNFWLRDDYSGGSICIDFSEIEDLKEIIRRLEDKLGEEKTED